MPQRPIEMILARQLAMNLSTAVFIVDSNGALLFFNEAAERLLGFRVGDGEVTEFASRMQALAPRDEGGQAMPPSEMPGVMAMRERAPVHARLWLRAHDGEDRFVEASAVPIEGAEGRTLGGMVMFWETRDRGTA